MIPTYFFSFYVYIMIYKIHIAIFLHFYIFSKKYNIFNKFHFDNMQKKNSIKILY